MYFQLKNGWTVVDMTHSDAIAYNLPWIARQMKHDKQSVRRFKPSDEIHLDDSGTWSDELPNDELEAMTNLVCEVRGDVEYVVWDGVAYGPFDLRTSYVRRIDGIIVVMGSYRDNYWLIAQGVARGPFRGASTPRFVQGIYFHFEHRMDGIKVVVYSDREHPELSGLQTAGVHVTKEGMLEAYSNDESLPESPLNYMVYGRHPRTIVVPT